MTTLLKFVSADSWLKLSRLYILKVQNTHFWYIICQGMSFTNILWCSYFNVWIIIFSLGTFRSKSKLSCAIEQGLSRTYLSTFQALGKNILLTWSTYVWSLSECLNSISLSINVYSLDEKFVLVGITAEMPFIQVKTMEFKTWFEDSVWLQHVHPHF